MRRPATVRMLNVYAEAASRAFGHPIEASVTGLNAVLDEIAKDAEPHEPHRGSDVEAWIKRARDEYGSSTDDAWRVLDDLLDDYRDHADTGTALTDEVEGPHGADS